MLHLDIHRLSMEEPTMADTETVTKTASLTDVQKYFGYTNLAQFRKDWVELDDATKKDLRNGIGNGTFTY